MIRKEILPLVFENKTKKKSPCKSPGPQHKAQYNSLGGPLANPNKIVIS